MRPPIEVPGFSLGMLHGMASLTEVTMNVAVAPETYNVSWPPVYSESVMDLSGDGLTGTV